MPRSAAWSSNQGPSRPVSPQPTAHNTPVAARAIQDPAGCRVWREPASRQTVFQVAQARPGGGQFLGIRVQAFRPRQRIPGLVESTGLR